MDHRDLLLENLHINRIARIFLNLLPDGRFNTLRWEAFLLSAQFGFCLPLGARRRLVGSQAAHWSSSWTAAASSHLNDITGLCLLWERSCSFPAFISALRGVFGRVPKSKSLYQVSCQRRQSSAALSAPPSLLNDQQGLNDPNTETEPKKVCLTCCCSYCDLSVPL